MNILTKKVEELDEALKKDLGTIELDVTTSYTLADAIREGCVVTTKTDSGWGDGETACAMSAAVIAARRRGFIRTD